MSKKIYRDATERKAAYRRRRREREALSQRMAEGPVPATVPVRSVDQILAELHQGVRVLAAECARGCRSLEMERQPWLLRAVDASRAFAVLRHIASELNRLAG